MLLSMILNVLYWEIEMILDELLQQESTLFYLIKCMRSLKMLPAHWEMYYTDFIIKYGKGYDKQRDT